ncbi:hypothetical protein SDC9_183866 [bioreactor metagenome]|uniref:Uncharacterized protein n=1 Tax=bioreactor metagenome TaxID=1076179 RepID=A0A645HBF5_9ZZZZ
MRVVSHQPQKFVDLFIQRGGITGNVPVGRHGQFLQATHLTANLMALLFIQARQIVFKIAVECDIRRSLQRINLTLQPQIQTDFLQSLHAGGLLKNIIQADLADL